MLHDTKTNFVKAEHANKQYILIDAADAVLGRLSAYVASILMGKNKTCVTRSNDVGDYVIIVNADKVRLTGDKMTKKLHYWHTGAIGGIRKAVVGSQILHGKSDEVIRRSVKGMLPRGPLGYKMLTHLHVYGTSEHPHVAQQPKVVDFLSLNKKNNIRRSDNE